VKGGLAEGSALAMSGEGSPESAQAEGRVGPDWVIDPSLFDATMTLIARVEREGVEISHEEARVALFSGDQLRGLGEPIHVPSKDRHLFFVMVYGTSAVNEELEMRVFDAETGIVHERVGTIVFHADQSAGTIADPIAVQISLSADGTDAGVPDSFALYAATRTRSIR
jgi:hypothetical protein